ncbi:MAG: hypothetical protein MUE48_09075, partial [Desulfobacterales bacterium]|nr:hypothetical protein [Desulfobacterales bacterium]
MLTLKNDMSCGSRSRTAASGIVSMRQPASASWIFSRRLRRCCSIGFRQRFAFQKGRVAGADEGKRVLGVEEAGVDARERAALGKDVGDDLGVPAQELPRGVGDEDDLLEHLPVDREDPVEE